MPFMSLATPKDAQSGPEPARYHPLVIVLAAVAAGIVFDHYRPLPVLLWWTIAAGSLAGWLVLWRRGRLGLAAAAILLATAAAAASWHHCRWYLFAGDDLGHFARETHRPVCVEAIALKSPRQLPRPAPDPMRLMPASEAVRLEVQITAIRDGADWRPASGRARMVVDAALPEVQAGDRLRIFAHLSLPARPMNPGEFDHRALLRADRIRSQLRTEYAEAISLVAAGNAWSPRWLLEQVRMHGNRIFEKYLGGRHPALASAVLLGIREQLDPETTEAFVETGTVHLLVIAGLHLGILAGTVLLVVRRLPIPRGWALAAAASFTLAYMLLVDAQPPVVRATVLILATCGGLYFGRHRPTFNVLAAAGLVVLILNPADLFLTGTQLSFLCVAGLMALAPGWIHSSREQDPVERLLAANRSWAARLTWALGRSLRHITLVSATIWLLTLPLVMARFHLFNPIGVLLNTAVWIPMATALLSGFALLVLGTLLPPAAPPIAGLCNQSLGLLHWLVGLGQRCPGGHVWVPGPPDWWLLGAYGGLGLLAAFPGIRPPRRWGAALMAGWIAVGFGAAGLRSHPHRLDCTFLSVGHGEAIVLELPTGQTVLYDVGQFSAPVHAWQATAGFLWSRGLTHLDAVVLSHGDVDHYNGLPGLLERFSVGAVYISPVMWENQNAALHALRRAIDAAGVPIREVSAGRRLAAGPDCTMEVLHPPRHGVLGRENANSLVLAVEYRGRRILLTGDLEPPGLTDVLAEPPAHCDVLLVPHHGSRQSDPAGLAAWSTPSWAIISADHRWDLSPVAATYQRVGSRVLHTADTGAVTASIDGEGLRMRTFLGVD